MKLIVDTNRLIAALIKDSYSRGIILHMDAEFITLHFSLKEIRDHSNEVMEKARLSSDQFNLLVEKLIKRCILIDDDTIEQKMEEAKQIMDSIDPDDTPFIAAALATGADIWSDDAHFDAQTKVEVWKTKDLIKLIQKNNDSSSGEKFYDEKKIK